VRDAEVDAIQRRNPFAPVGEAALVFSTRMVHIQIMSRAARPPT